MNASKLRDLIDKVIGKNGPLRVPAWWMRGILQTIVDSVESVASSVPKVDSSMSDTSTNAVQNNVIKAYVDEVVANSTPEIGAIMSDTSTNAVQNKVIKAYVDTSVYTLTTQIFDNEKVVAAALNDLKSEIEELKTQLTALQEG